MACWVDEVEAAVDAVVDDVPAIQTTLICEIFLKLRVDVANDGLEAVENIGESNTPENTAIKQSQSYL